MKIEETGAELDGESRSRQHAESGYRKIAALKQKRLDAGVSTKKSEFLRAGLLLLESALTERLLAAISAVETVKTGRSAKS